MAGDDGRSGYERNVDRFYYLAAWRRLANITQVTEAGGGRLVHNRLTHSIKVSQVGRRIAQALVSDDPALEELIDPDVVAAAGLAHDIGHAPFGHNGEHELDRIARDHELDGYEGNAQAFRILTRLTQHIPSASGSVRSTDFKGLGLDPRVLAATVKYPWKRSTDISSHEYSKFGFYAEDAEVFRTQLAHLTAGGPTIEAQIMDWADDITYALHDVEDFYIAGLIPLHDLRCNPAGSPVNATRFEEFMDYAQARLGDKYAAGREEFVRIAERLPQGPFDGTQLERARLSRLTSDLISTLIPGATVKAGRLNRGREGASDALVSLMKQLTWFYVIAKPDLAQSQIGARAALRRVVTDHISWAKRILDPSAEHRNATDAVTISYGLRSLPPTLAELLLDARAPAAFRHSDDNADRVLARAVIDYVSSLTEEEVLKSYRELTGGSQ